MAEEGVEASAIIILFVVGYFIMLLYQKEVSKNSALIDQLSITKDNLESQLEEIFKYVGALNVQIREMRSVFSDIKKYPDNKKDFKNIVDFLANKILGIVAVDWAVIRIIDLNNFQTLTEGNVNRGDNKPVLKNGINNVKLTKGQAGEGRLVFSSHQDNLKISAFCVMPAGEISDEQEMFIKSIVGQLEMFYFIYSTLTNNKKETL